MSFAAGRATVLHMSFATDSFEAIGVLNQVTVADPAVLSEAGEIARAEVAALDLACSRFRTDSELSMLNRARGRPTKVSPLLLAALETAIYAAVLTDGRVDPTVGRAMRGLGYDRDFEIVVARGGAPRFAFVAAGGWRDIRIDHDSRLVTVPRGYELDLGATAKALAADTIAAAVHEATDAAILVSLGGDISVAGAAPTGGWPVFVTDASRRSDGPGQTVAIHAGGLATSSTTVRRWTAAGIEVHHIVDPVSGAPALGPWRTVSVAAPTCVDANLAATAAIVLGSAAGAWLEDRGVAARLVDGQGSVIATGAWPAHSSFTAAGEPVTADSQEYLAPLVP
jgi:thiamine biosynthesis lipoprotein